MKTFNDLIFVNRPIDNANYMELIKQYPTPWETDYGIWSNIIFDNGYGARVAKGPQTIGGPDGLYEISVLDSSGIVLETSSVMTGSIGSLDEAGVTDYMQRIQSI
jgi:hypothetical protein